MASRRRSCRKKCSQNSAALCNVVRECLEVMKTELKMSKVWHDVSISFGYMEVSRRKNSNIQNNVLPNKQLYEEFRCLIPNNSGFVFFILAPQIKNCSVTLLKCSLHYDDWKFTTYFGTFKESGRWEFPQNCQICLKLTFSHHFFLNIALMIPKRSISLNRTF
jgi:hypothetical protein